MVKRMWVVVEGQLKLRILFGREILRLSGKSQAILKYFNCGHVSESIKSSNISKTFQLFYSYPW